MSTRCNLIVKYGKNRVYLYRHHDGYPAECGAMIAESLKHALDCGFADFARFNRFMHSLIANQYEATSFREAKPIYEFTSGLHSDVEYVYEINFNRDPSRIIRIAERGPEWHVDSGEGFAPDRWTEGGAWFSLAGLVERVNRDRKDCNTRLARLRDQSSSSVYKDAADYEMLAA